MSHLSCRAPVPGPEPLIRRLRPHSGPAVGDPLWGTGDRVTRLVREALAHLADPVYLQTHPLAGLVAPAGAGWPAGRAGEALRRRLLGAIADLEPPAKSGERGASRRGHRLLELRYAEGLPPEAVQDQLGLSRAQYFREQARAVAAVASFLVPSSPAADSGQTPEAPAPPVTRPAAPAATTGQAPRRDNLPVALTSFVGRERALDAIVRRLSGDAGVPLLTLSGPGGIGKTRLALEAAAAGPVRDAFPDGIWLVEFAPLADPALVPSAVAAALGLRASAGRSLPDALADALRPGRVLLVLDNCEHLLDACAALAEHLLRACPGLRVLATSRQALGAPGEVTWLVPPLAPPQLPSPAAGAAGPARLPAAAVATSGAVRLFVERAQAALPTFRLTDDNAPAVAEVCRRLDGIPLALELAAARVGALTVDLIARRLGDRLRLLTGGSRTVLPRHRTLRALLDWSHDLLSPPERLLFRRLAVFAGGWTLEAAEAVGAGDGVEPDGVLDLLVHLLDKSLVLPEAGADGVGRYRLLETVREYAAERLEAGESATVRRRHATHFLALAELAEPALRGPAQTAWLGRLDAEHDNLRAALRWALESDEIETGLRLSGALVRYWEIRGHLAEGRGWLKAFLARAPAGGALATSRAKASNATGNLAKLQGDYAAAGAAYEQSLALWRAACDRRGIANAVFNLGEAARGQGDYARAVAYYEDGLRLHRELENDEGVAAALTGLGIAARNRGELDQAEAYYEEALVYHRRRGDRQALAVVLNNLATVAGSRGRLKRAAALQEESLALRRELGDPRGTALALKNLADIATLQGDPGQAATRLAEAVELYGRVGSKDGVAVCLEGFARVAVARRPARAARLLGAAEALREALGAPLAPADRADRDACVATARLALGVGTLATLGEAGRAMTLEQAVAYALAAEPPTPAGGALTPRQREVAVLVARGHTNRQIAAALVIAERTAETHVDHILTRLGFTSRAQIAAWATEHGLRRATAAGGPGVTA